MTRSATRFFQLTKVVFFFNVSSGASGGLTGVRPAMRLQVGALGVHLVAAGEVAAVDSPLLQCVGRLCGDGVVCARVHDH